MRYQSNSRNDVKYQSNSRNDVKYQSDSRDNRYQSDFRDNRYQPNLRDEIRSNRNEAGNDRYNSKFQDVRKQKFYYEDIYQQQPSPHSAVESVHQSMHSPPSRISVQSHTFQIQSIRRPISQRSHTIINQPFFTFQNPSFHCATNQPGTLPETSQSRYVFAVSFALTYVFAIDNAFVYAFTNASVYIPVYASDNAFVYAFTYVPVYAFAAGYEPATDYASKSESTSTSTRTSRFETTVLD